MAGPLIILYGFSILIVKVVNPAPKEEEDEEEEEEQPESLEDKTKTAAPATDTPPENGSDK